MRTKSVRLFFSCPRSPMPPLSLARSFLTGRVLLQLWSEGSPHACRHLIQLMNLTITRKMMTMTRQCYFHWLERVLQISLCGGSRNGEPPSPQIWRFTLRQLFCSFAVASHCLFKYPPEPFADAMSVSLLVSRLLISSRAVACLLLLVRGNNGVRICIVPG